MTQPPPAEIEISNQQRLLKIAPHRIRRLVRFVFQAEHQPHGSISVALVDDQTIAELHQRYLDVNSPTDVITFPLSDKQQPICGEIVISTQTAIRQALEHGTEPGHEVLLYVTHGLLHLCGYDDSQPPARRAMQRKQEKLLRDFLGQG